MIFQKMSKPKYFNIFHFSFKKNFFLCKELMSINNNKFLKLKDYEEIKIYHRQILEEFKNRNKERFNAYFNRLNNHILFIF